MHVLERRSCSRWHVFVIDTDICEVPRKIFPTRFKSGQKVPDFVWEYETWNAEISKRESTFFIRIVDVYTCHWQGHLGCSVQVCRCLKFALWHWQVCGQSLLLESGIVDFNYFGHRNRSARRNRFLLSKFQTFFLLRKQEVDSLS